jgi:hypothetical protein
MNVKRFRTTFIAMLVVLFVLVEVARLLLFPSLDSWTGRLVLDLVILAAAVFVFGNGFDMLAIMERRLDRAAPSLRSRAR